MAVFTSWFHAGLDYMRIWPQEKVLGALFPEPRVIAAVTLALKVLPGLAGVSLLLQWHYGLVQWWPSVITTVLFMLSLPLQGLYWLGQRARSPLPAALSRWYFEVNAKLGQPALPSSPSYLDLARTLRQAFDKLDRAFLDL
ncbi:MAG: DUF412 domain-containing protein [Aeromonadaceae bacterium]|nr:DUF412 domain-containing protein [Aeromonadaceae bacterium]